MQSNEIVTKWIYIEPIVEKDEVIAISSRNFGNFYVYDSDFNIIANTDRIVLGEGLKVDVEIINGEYFTRILPDLFHDNVTYNLRFGILKGLPIEKATEFEEFIKNDK